MGESEQRKLTIHLAHRTPNQAADIAQLLESLGHHVPLVTASAETLMTETVDHGADLLVATPQLCDGDGIGTLVSISDRRPTPSIVIAGTDDLAEVERAMDDHVMAYLVEPVRAENLLPAIYVAMRHFEHFNRLETRVEKLERRLAERRTIERAKGIVMQSRGISESDAHALLQQLARNRRERLIEVSRRLLGESEPEPS